MLLLVIITVLTINGCETQTIMDERTKPTIHTVKAVDNSLIIRSKTDAMLGYDDYSREELVIDRDYYVKNPLQRGDVVYFRNPEFQSEKYPKLQLEEHQLLRVVALEGERVRLRQGQVYINGKRLDTFYGRMAGESLEQLKEKVKDMSLQDYERNNIRSRIRYIEEEADYSEITVPAGHVFLLGDNRSRAADSTILGPIPIASIMGKVAGIMEKHAWEESPAFAFSWSKAGLPERLRGEQGRLAVEEARYLAGKPYQGYWFFWGKPEELEGPLEVVGVKQGEERSRSVVFAAGGISRGLQGVDGYVPPSNMTLPAPGLWRLEAYIGGKYFGSLVVRAEYAGNEQAGGIRLGN